MITLPAALADRLDAYATEQGLTRDEAAAYLLDLTLQMGTLDHTLNTLHNQAMATLFADVWDDQEAFYIELHENCTDSFGHVETNEKSDSEDLPDFVMDLGIYYARGQWIVEVGRYDHAHRDAPYEWEIAQDEVDAIRRYTRHIKSLTEQHWSGGYPLWGEGISGDYLGIDRRIKWRGLLPEGSVWQDGKTHQDYLDELK